MLGEDTGVPDESAVVADVAVCLDDETGAALGCVAGGFGVDAIAEDGSNLVLGFDFQHSGAFMVGMDSGASGINRAIGDDDGVGAVGGGFGMDAGIGGVDVGGGDEVPLSGTIGVADGVYGG